jgi:hypothetical protein
MIRRITERLATVSWWLLPVIVIGAAEWLFISRAIYRATTGGAD